jgi:hypothetical protein
MIPFLIGSTGHILIPFLTDEILVEKWWTGKLLPQIAPKCEY